MFLLIVARIARRCSVYSPQLTTSVQARHLSSPPSILTGFNPQRRPTTLTAKVRTTVVLHCVRFISCQCIVPSFV